MSPASESCQWFGLGLQRKDGRWVRGLYVDGSGRPSEASRSTPRPGMRRRRGWWRRGRKVHAGAVMTPSQLTSQVVPGEWLDQVVSTTGAGQHAGVVPIQCGALHDPGAGDEEPAEVDGT